MHMCSTSILIDVEQAENITLMDPGLYNAAAKGDINAFKAYTEGLHLLLTPNKNTLLHIHMDHITTAERGNMELSTGFVEEILDKCPSLLRQANANDKIPLHLAARYGLSNTVKVLVERARTFQEADPEKGDVRQMVGMTNKEKDTALHEAVRFDHIEVVKLLIKEDPDLSNSANVAGETPLYLAVERGFRSLVMEILRTCTSPAHCGPNGRTPLHAAVIVNDEEILKEILKGKGVDLTKEEDQQGWTPLHYAAHLGYSHMVELLLKVDTSAAYLRDKEGKRTALHIAARWGNVDIVKNLITYCPDCCELVDKRGWNFLHFAVESRNLWTIDVVFENNTDVPTYLLNAKDNEGNTPLHRLANHRGPPTYWRVYNFIEHYRVDKMALNKKNQSALNIINANATLDVKWKGHTTEDLRKAGANNGRRNITYEDYVNTRRKDEEETYLTEIKKRKETHIIVATLIATVAFTASFTMPDGYLNDKGTPVLASK